MKNFRLLILKKNQYNEHDQMIENNWNPKERKWIQNHENINIKITILQNILMSKFQPLFKIVAGSLPISLRRFDVVEVARGLHIVEEFYF